MHEKASAISDFLCIIANGAGSKKDQEFAPPSAVPGNT